MWSRPTNATKGPDKGSWESVENVENVVKSGKQRGENKTKKKSNSVLSYEVLYIFICANSQGF